MHIDFDRLNDEYPVELVLRTRLNVKVHNGTFKCPFHDDRNESGSIYRDAITGRTRFKCHSAGCGVGGDAMDLARLATGSDDIGVQHRWLTGENEPRPSRIREPDGRPRAERVEKPDRGGPPDLNRVFDLVPIPPEALTDIMVGKETPDILHTKNFRKVYTPRLVHAYVDGSGRTVMLIVRIDTGKNGKTGKIGKAFIPLRWDRREGWCSTGFQPGEERLFYREPQLDLYPDRPVLVLEGEHKTDLLAALPAFDDYVAISWAGGAATMKHQRWAKLKGRRVVFWPDADPTANGDDFKTRTATEAAARACEAAEVRIVQPLQAWLDKDCGFDAKDMLEEMRAEGKPASAARALMESLAVPFAPDMPPPPGAKLPPGEVVWVCKPIRGTLMPDPRDEANLMLWLRDLDPGKGGYRGRLSRDVFTNEVLLDDEPLSEGMGVREISYQVARDSFLRGVTADRVRAIVSDVADATPVNRLADAIRSLTWDRQQRILLGYAGAEVEGDAGRWARVAGHRWLLGLVRRILSPGWQHDGVLVLQGKQGMQKTSFFRTVGTILGRDAFVEIDKLTRDPDTQMLLKGKAVAELSEMIASRHGDTDPLKGMLTARVDVYRRPYARAPESVPRTCVFGGSTNEAQFLKDQTGNRRYWIVPVTGTMRLQDLERDLPQLLAQAVWFLEHGTPQDRQNWLTAEEEVMQEETAKSYEIEWTQFDGLDEWLEREVVPSKRFITRQEIWKGLEFQTNQRGGNTLQQALTKMMQERGWELGRRDGVSHGPRGFRKVAGGNDSGNDSEDRLDLP